MISDLYLSLVSKSDKIKSEINPTGKLIYPLAINLFYLIDVHIEAKNPLLTSHLYVCLQNLKLQFIHFIFINVPIIRILIFGKDRITYACSLTNGFIHRDKSKKELSKLYRV